MNKVELIGRLTGAPEIRVSANQEYKVARFTLAVDRKVGKEKESQADFISCEAWNKKADVAEKYFKKGLKIAVVGRIQTGSYDKNGEKRYTTNVVIEDFDFCEPKGATDGFSMINAPIEVEADGFMNIPEGIAEELPFANIK